MDKLPYEELKRLLNEARQLVKPGSKWRHYKGAAYVVSDVSIVEANNEVAVIYASVAHPSVSFVRPLSVWLEVVALNGQTVQRFSEQS